MDSVQLLLNWAQDENSISLFFSMIITVIFYRQYKKWEREIEDDKMIDNFLS